MLDADGAVLDAGAADLDSARRMLAVKLPAGTVDPQGHHLDLERPVQIAALAS